jgi:simple sugar transport system permease protein/ribose transport system permease protein
MAAEPTVKTSGSSHQTSGADASKWTAGRVADVMLDNIVWLLLVSFSIVAGLASPFFLTTANLQNILVQATVLSMVALAVGVTLLIAEIDLSVIGNLVFCGLVGVLLMRAGVPGVVAIPATVVTGAAVGLVNGIFVAKLKMNSLIETLAMGLVLTGAVLAITEGKTLTVEPSSYTYLGNARVGGWPFMPLAFIVTYVIAGIVSTRTAWGRRLYAVGGNPRAAAAAGIRTDAIRVQAFIVAGIIAGAAGFLQTSYLSGVNTTVASDLLLYAVAAPVIGGVSLFGGYGRVIGLLGGALLITVTQVALQIVNVSAYYVQMVGGGMILLAVFVDAIRIRRRGL